MIGINILFLGPAKDFAGTDSCMLEVEEPATVEAVRTLLVEKYPSLRAAMPSIRLAVNQRFAKNDTTVRDGDEIALIPPVSGGSDDDGIFVDLVSKPIDQAIVQRFVAGDPSLGGITTFAGATRNEEDAEHGRLVRLDYEAYETMARAQLRRLAAEARARWSAGRVALIHRLGPIPPGEVSVLIAVACPHRAESFEACRWLIDTLKQDVPIWKKDVFEDGFVRWVKSEFIATPHGEDA